VDAPFGAPLLIHNPQAGRGDGDELARTVTLLRARGFQPTVASTELPGDAARLAREAVASGTRYVIAVGGDGTINEVLHGLVDPEAGTLVHPDVVLGVVGAGSGSDLVRTFGLDRTPERLIDHLTSADTLQLDVGRVRLTGLDGRPSTRVFLNVAELGYGGRVVQLANRLPRRIGRLRYAAAIGMAVARFRRVETTVAVDGGTTTEPVCNVVVANAQFFGGGLHVAPRALPTDGRFNVQSWGGRPIDVIRAQPQLRRGTHLARTDVREWQSTTVHVDAPEPLVVEADGEVLGTTPATFDLLPGLLAFKL
jgi:diacylglycerol kinase (ATP)